MDVAPGTTPRPGQPRSERDAAFLERFDAWMQLPIVVSAILPLVIIPESNGWVGVLVGVVSWLVFLVDYVMYARHLEHYGRTRFGRFDLFVVIATAPWFLFPGAQAGQFVVLLRLARLARLLMASRGARRLFERLGRVALVAGGVLVTGSLVAYHAEHPVNPEFATVGDALWWGIVTLTTVGYGDIVPKTTTGRWVAVVIMVTGIAVLGLLAGSLASFFRLDNGTPSAGSPPADQTEDAVATSSDAAVQALATEVSALRLQVEALAARLTGALPGLAPQETEGDEGVPHNADPRLQRSHRQLGNWRPSALCALTCVTGGPRVDNETPSLTGVNGPNGTSRPAPPSRPSSPPGWNRAGTGMRRFGDGAGHGRFSGQTS